MEHPEFTMSQYKSKEALFKAMAEYYQNLVSQYEEGVGDPLGDAYIVVTERDHPEPIKSRGAIAMETYTGTASLCESVERVKYFNGRYGKAVICKLVPIGGIKICERIINEPYYKANEQLTSNQASIYIYAARYAHTRNTGAALQVVTQILAVWNKLPYQAKEQLAREAENEAIYNAEDWSRIIEMFRKEK